MKEILENLGFETLPSLRKFIEAVSTIKIESISTRHHELQAIHDYLKFISQPISKGMFIPCDEKGNYLPQPTLLENCTKDCRRLSGCECQNEKRAHTQAVENVLFQGFDIRTVQRAGAHSKPKENILCRDGDTYHWDFERGYLWDIQYGQSQGHISGWTIEETITYGCELKLK